MQRDQLTVQYGRWGRGKKRKRYDVSGFEADTAGMMTRGSSPGVTLE